jgi:hypothetical protein
VDEWTHELFQRCECLFEEFVGHTFEFKRVEVFRHPDGRCIERLTKRHIDADEERETCRWLTEAEAQAVIARVRRDGLTL